MLSQKIPLFDQFISKTKVHFTKKLPFFKFIVSCIYENPHNKFWHLTNVNKYLRYICCLDIYLQKGWLRVFLNYLFDMDTTNHQHLFNKVYFNFIYISCFCFSLFSFIPKSLWNQIRMLTIMTDDDEVDDNVCKICN